MPVITASEVGQYTFCARSWWLGRIKGYPCTHVQEMANGQAAHLAHGRIVMLYHRMQRLAYALLLMAMLVGALWIYFLARGW